MKRSQLLTAAACAAIILCGSRYTAYAADITDPADPADSAAPAEPAKADETEETGWFTENGKRYFRLDTGALATGEYTVDGVPYLFAPNGAQQRGWQTVSGQRRYYDENGEAVTGWFTWRGEQYYIDPDEGKQTDSLDTDGLTVHFDEYGVLQHEWAKREDGVWCYTGCTGETEIDGLPYLLGEDSALLSGWQTPSDGCTRYYDADTHAPLTGWVRDDDAVYYADAARGRLTGEQVIDGASYLFSETGEQLTGLQTVNGAVRCYGGENGEMLTSTETEIDGNTYRFGENGDAVTGLVYEKGNYIFFGEDGVMQKGFVRFEEGLRYFNENGRSAIGMVTIDGKTYYFNADSIAETGWNAFGMARYYFSEEDGAALTGWQEIDGKAYRFRENGTLCNTPTAVDGVLYVFDTDGQLVSGWYDAADGSRYYGNEDGTALTGWQELENRGVYFSPETGKLAVSTTIDGFTIDETGTARSSMAVTVDINLGYTNKTPMGIYSYMINHYRYSRIEATRSVTALGNAGWDKLVTYLLKNKRGVCYYLAATMDFYLQRAGYTTRMIHANHSTGDHYWNQVLVNGAWQNYDPTYNNRGNISWNTQIALGSYKVLGVVRVKYDVRGAYLGWEYGSL